MVDHLRKQALALGFDEAKPLNIATLQPMEMVRDMCAADKCHAYGKNWTCPPHCGTLEQCAAKLQSYRHGLLLQTVGYLKKRVDGKTIAQTEQRHLEQFHRFAVLAREYDPNALCLGAGGCRICKVCAWPESCRLPEKACSSMEGYGLFVTQVCRDNDLPYHHGEGTITFTACVLFDREDQPCTK